MRPISFIWGNYTAAVANSIALTQTPLAAGDLALAGALATGGIATLVLSGQVTITSAGNDSGKTFTIYGTNNSGSIVSEAITGGNAAAVTSALSYKTITRIAVSAATAAAVTAGNAQSGNTDWIPLDIYNPNQVTNISATVTGTINYTVQYTNEDPFDYTIAQQVVSHPVAALVAATTSQTAGATTTLMRAVRFKVNSGDGSARVTIVQQSTL